MAYLPKMASLFPREFTRHLRTCVRVTWFPQEAGGKVTDSRGELLDFSLGAKLPREVWNGRGWVARAMPLTLVCHSALYLSTEDSKSPLVEMPGYIFWQPSRQ